MTAKIIKLNRTNFHDFLDKTIKAYEENRLNDFICIVSHKYPEGEEEEGFYAAIDNYWFSGDNGSCVHSLGLLELMKKYIIDYMKGKDEEQ